ncbi:MAG: SpoIIE family protein phosphatase [Ardenticatenaceae bacterium]|nr:SpoIIE family protein phosphatase [Ardenticatenaceae bacterium]
MTKTGATTIIKTTFAGVDEETLNILRQMASLKEYPAQTVLCRQGEIEHTFYVVVNGRLSVVQRVDEGEERLLGLLGSNAIFGEMSLIDNSPRMATVTTLSPTTVLEITEQVFDQLVVNSPAIAYAVVQRILASTRQLDHRSIEELKNKNEALEQAYEALQAAQAKLVEKERLERELELAAAVQRDLLPGDLPQFPDYRFAAYLQPARQVGGDFYDVMVLDEEHAGLLIADVADKGFHAALFMAVSRTLFFQESRYSLSPAVVAQAVHSGMMGVAKSADSFVTAFYGVLHRPSGRLTYARAGHDRPLLYRPGGEVEMLMGNGRFLGMWSALSLDEYDIYLEPGSRLVMYSDGVTDAVNPYGERYGVDRLRRVLQENGRLPAAELKNCIADDIAQFRQNAPAFDDLTLLVVEAVSE